MKLTKSAKSIDRLLSGTIDEISDAIRLTGNIVKEHGKAIAISCIIIWAIQRYLRPMVVILFYSFVTHCVYAYMLKYTGLWAINYKTWLCGYTCFYWLAVNMPKY